MYKLFSERYYGFLVPNIILIYIIVSIEHNLCSSSRTQVWGIRLENEKKNKQKIAVYLLVYTFYSRKNVDFIKTILRYYSRRRVKKAFRVSDFN